jgi:hypothetical protein
LATKGTTVIQTTRLRGRKRALNAMALGPSHQGHHGVNGIIQTVNVQNFNEFLGLKRKTASTTIEPT